MDDEEEEIEIPIETEVDRKVADAFSVYDHSGENRIDCREVGTILRGLGLCPTEVEVQEVVATVEDAQMPGTCHLVKFLPTVVQILNENRYQAASADQLLAAFRTLDTDNRGFLSREAISALMTQYGEPFGPDELEEMLEVALDRHTDTVPYESYINKLLIR